MTLTAVIAAMQQQAAPAVEAEGVTPLSAQVGGKALPLGGPPPPPPLPPGVMSKGPSVAIA